MLKTHIININEMRKNLNNKIIKIKIKLNLYQDFISFLNLF